MKASKAEKGATPLGVPDILAFIDDLAKAKLTVPIHSTFPAGGDRVQIAWWAWVGV